MDTYPEVKRDILQKEIILFDGVCNLCNGAVNFIIDRDPGSRFNFASLQSDVGRQLLLHYNIDPAKTDSVVLITNGKAYVKSRAALEIARRLSGPWPAFYVFRIVPVALGDGVYNIIARNRYKWFGKEESCRLPAPGLTSRFIG